MEKDKIYDKPRIKDGKHRIKPLSHNVYGIREVLNLGIPASEFTVGNWKNIVVWNNGSTTKLYLDGVEKGSIADSVNYNASCPLTVGQNIAGGNFWTSALFDEIGKYFGRVNLLSLITTVVSLSKREGTSGNLVMN